MARKACLVLWCLIACSVAFVRPVAAQTADELVQKYLTALGGAQKLKAIQSLRATGTMTMGPMAPSPFTSIKSRPSSMRTEIVMNGATITQAFDGTTGWSVIPPTGVTRPQRVSEAIEADMRSEADFDPWPLDYKARGTTVEYLGRDTLDGKATYKLRVTRRNGVSSLIWLDAATYLETRSETTRDIQGQSITAETISSIYQPVEGVMFPMRVESRPKGQPVGQVVEISRVELNPKIDAGIFAMPGSR